MVDTHAHIYLPEFSGDRADIITNAREAGVKQILMPAIDSRTHGDMLALEAQFGECISMMGLHPCSVNADYQQELNLVKDHLDQRDFIAIGEIGLDFYWDTTFKDQQYDAFHRQIEIAIQKNIPIVIHSRNSTEECVEVVKQYKEVRGVFHCFSGNLEQAQQISSLNFMLGIGGVVTFKNAGLDKIISEVGINDIILETDAPYLAPAPFRGKRNEPSYLKFIIEKISAITGKSVQEIEAITTANARRLFDLK
jgi:TatD DNase family protein